MTLFDRSYNPFPSRSLQAVLLPHILHIVPDKVGDPADLVDGAGRGRTLYLLAQNQLPFQSRDKSTHSRIGALQVRSHIIILKLRLVPFFFRKKSRFKIKTDFRTRL